MLKLAEDPISLAEIPPKKKDVQFIDATIDRPETVKGIIYKMQSNFVRHNIYITMGYMMENGKPRPVEIFINSKDLSKSPEYTVLTRLISAIFRKTPNPVFILEELSSINDPNGGYHKNGKYIHSFYSEVASVIETFFKEIGVIDKEPKEKAAAMSISINPSESKESNEKENVNEEFQICKECGEKAVKMENGCSSCTACGDSKCGG